MKRLLCVILSLLPLMYLGGVDFEVGKREILVRFMPLDIYLDSGENLLAAYQFELIVTSGDVRIVGVEGGEDPAFNDAPYYDPEALTHDRIVIAAYSMDTDLPTGRTRIATLHLQVTGDIEPEFELVLTVSADANGEPIPATLTFEQGEI